MVLTDHPICRFCECPAADGNVPVSKVDLQKLSEWCLTHLGEELDELDFDNDVFCHFCILDARFLADNDENSERDDLRWWPEEETSQSDISKMLYKYNEVVKNCWVTLERIEVDEEDEEEGEGEREELINLPNEDHQSNSDEEVSIVEIVPRLKSNHQQQIEKIAAHPESNNQQQVEVIPNPQPCNQQQNNPAGGFLLLGAPGQTFVLPTLLGVESNIIYYVPAVETVPQPPITQFYTTGGFPFLSAPCQPPALGTFVAPMNVVVPPPPPPPVAAPSFGRRIAPAPPKTPPMDITPKNNKKGSVPYNTLHSASFKKLEEKKDFTKNDEKRVHVSNKFGCIFCSKSYLNKSDLRRHVHIKHKQIAYECLQCKAFFKSQENLDLHFEQEHEAFEKRKQLKTTKNEKKQEHVKKKLEIFGCIFCSTTFLRKDIMKRHVYNKHKNIAFECPHCTAFFKRQEYLDLHFKQEHEAFEKMKIHQCKKCDQKFVVIESLEWHIAKDHSEKTLLCEKCSKMFSSKQILQEHIIRHLSASKCSSCSCEISRSRLKQHQNSRACSKCFQLFPCAKIFKEHRRKCKFICHICPQGREFATEVALRHHLFLHTLKTKRKFRSKLTENNDGAGHKKWVTCDFCRKIFVNKQSILKHFMMIHSIGESKHVCGICDKKFAAKVSLFNHVKYTHLKMLVKCKICSKSIRADVLKSHCMVKHSVLPQ